MEFQKSAPGASDSSPHHQSDYPPLAERLAAQLDSGLERKLTGSLILGASLVDGQVLFLRDGYPSKARTSEVVAPLDETLLSMGLLDEETLIDSYETACDTTTLLGAVLVEQGLIDPQTLLRALRKQLAAKVAWMFELPADTPIHFHRNADLLDGYGGSERVGIDPQPLLMGGVCPVWSHPLTLASWLMDNTEAEAQTPASHRPVTVADVVATLEAQRNASHAQVLGIPASAPPERIVQAYVELTRRWHPDGLGEEQAKLRPAVARVYARIVSAYSALSYMRSHASRGTAPVRPVEPYGYDVASTLNSAATCQRAKHLYERGELEAAETVLRRAMELERDQPEFRVLFAWIKAERQGVAVLKPGETTDQYEWSIRILDRVLFEEPEYELARYRRGVLLRRSGHLDRAMADFQRVLELNPSHVDAAREVRLQEMRNERNGDSGIFRRMFSKSG